MLSGQLSRSSQGDQMGSPWWKRVLDIVISSLALLVLSLPLVIIAVAIRVTSPGPILFKQRRVGRVGVSFTIYKFRTMVQNAHTMRSLDLSDPGRLVFQDKDDPRVTAVGRILRRTSLDELPQLLNVLKGDMSIVGPRPEISEVVNLYTDHQRGRLAVLPGITGLAQINGRGDLSLDETIEWDLKYIEQLSFQLDLFILWRTLAVVVTGKGAY